MLSTLKKINDEQLYKVYITDALRHIVNNTAGQESRTMLKVSYRDLIHPTAKDDKDDEVKAEEIINRIKNKLKGG